MKVNWQVAENESPILYKNRAVWTGFDIRHWRVLAGELLDETRERHEINIALRGAVVTEKHTTTGRRLRYRNETDSVCFIPAGESAKAVWETEIECLSITLNPVFVRQTALEQNFAGEVEFVETFARPDPLIRHVALALLGEASGGESFGKIYAESLAQTLILHLLKNYTVKGAPREAAASGGLSGYRLRRAKEFIVEHLEEDITLAEVAEAAGYSPFHFARSFRRSTGLTPQQYLVQQRIGRAKELLTKGDLPLVEVAIGAGFKNQSHFTTLFRKFTALTPKAFREAKHQ